MEQEAILANLLELYAHDFSEFHEIELAADGRFGYPQLPSYWTDPARHPFLITLNGRWAGLVLVRRGSEISMDPEVWDMAEFFILRRYRRLHVGTAIARETWRRFPGAWEVRVMERNVRALAFWLSAVERFTGRAAASTPFERGGERWRLFRFVAGKEGV